MSYENQEKKEQSQNINQEQKTSTSPVHQRYTDNRLEMQSAAQLYAAIRAQTIANRPSYMAAPNPPKQRQVHPLFQNHDAAPVQQKRQASSDFHIQMAKDEMAKPPVTQRFEVLPVSDNEDVPIQQKENNTGLPDNLKSGIENLSGYSMDDVKVHYNSDKPAQLNAHAYAQGTDIHLASGQEQHLPHEAWHVVQQKQGRVKPTLQMKGGVDVNDDIGLEKEADVMGEKANNNIVNPLQKKSNNTIQRQVIQLKSLKELKNDVKDAKEKAEKLSGSLEEVNDFLEFKKNVEDAAEEAEKDYSDKKNLSEYKYIINTRDGFRGYFTMSIFSKAMKVENFNVVLEKIKKINDRFRQNLKSLNKNIKDKSNIDPQIKEFNNIGTEIKEIMPLKGLMDLTLKSGYQGTLSQEIQSLSNKVSEVEFLYKKSGKILKKVKEVERDKREESFGNEIDAVDDGYLDFLISGKDKTTLPEGLNNIELISLMETIRIHHIEEIPKTKALIDIVGHDKIEDLITLIKDINTKAKIQDLIDVFSSDSKNNDLANFKNLFEKLIKKPGADVKDIKALILTEKKGNPTLKELYDFVVQIDDKYKRVNHITNIWKSSLTIPELTIIIKDKEFPIVTFGNMDFQLLKDGLVLNDFINFIDSTKTPIESADSMQKIKLVNAFVKLYEVSISDLNSLMIKIGKKANIDDTIELMETFSQLGKGASVSDLEALIDKTSDLKSLKGILSANKKEEDAVHKKTPIGDDKRGEMTFKDTENIIDYTKHKWSSFKMEDLSDLMTTYSTLGAGISLADLKTLIDKTSDLKSLKGILRANKKVEDRQDKTSPIDDTDKGKMTFEDTKDIITHAETKWSSYKPEDLSGLMTTYSTLGAGISLANLKTLIDKTSDLKSLKSILKTSKQEEDAVHKKTPIGDDKRGEMTFKDTENIIDHAKSKFTTFKMEDLSKILTSISGIGKNLATFKQILTDLTSYGEGLDIISLLVSNMEAMLGKNKILSATTFMKTNTKVELEKMTAFLSSLDKSTPKRNYQLFEKSQLFKFNTTYGIGTETYDKGGSQKITCDRWSYFQQRHTYEHFGTGKIDALNSLWANTVHTKDHLNTIITTAISNMSGPNFNNIFTSLSVVGTDYIKINSPDDKTEIGIEKKSASSPRITHLMPLKADITLNEDEGNSILKLKP